MMKIIVSFRIIEKLRPSLMYVRTRSQLCTAKCINIHKRTYGQLSRNSPFISRYSHITTKPEIDIRYERCRRRWHGNNVHSMSVDWTPKQFTF